MNMINVAFINKVTMTHHHTVIFSHYLSRHGNGVRKDTANLLTEDLTHNKD